MTHENELSAPIHSPAPWSYEYSPYRMQQKPDGIESKGPSHIA